MKMEMSIIEIKPGIYSVGVIDRDRRLFDELILLSDGITYNKKRAFKALNNIADEIFARHKEIRIV